MPENTSSNSVDTLQKFAVPLAIVIAGAFILIENQFDEGDEIEINGKKGEVEKISLRIVSIRDKNGALYIIPNGSITMVSNFSKK